MSAPQGGQKIEASSAGALVRVADYAGHEDESLARGRSPSARYCPLTRRYGMSLVASSTSRRARCRMAGSSPEGSQGPGRKATLPAVRLFSLTTVGAVRRAKHRPRLSRPDSQPPKPPLWSDHSGSDRTRHSKLAATPSTSPSRTRSGDATTSTPSTRERHAPTTRFQASSANLAQPIELPPGRGFGAATEPAGHAHRA
jgi:hypothetical protein